MSISSDESDKSTSSSFNWVYRDADAVCVLVRELWDDDKDNVTLVPVSYTMMHNGGGVSSVAAAPAPGCQF